MRSLSGQIELIGILELLRVPLTSQKTGELLLINDVEDARCSFEQGKLVQCSLKDLRGTTALESVLQWQIGEFEFREAALSEALEREENLHKCLVAEIKRWYSSRIKSPASAAVNATKSTSFRAIKADGPQLKLVEPPTTAQETIRSIHFGALSNSEPGPNSEPGRKAAVHASVDLQGNILEQQGDFAADDAAISAITQQLAQAVGRAFSFSSLKKGELKSSDGKRLSFSFSENRTEVESFEP